MKSAVVVFPGINRERDMMLALESVTGSRPVSVWHTETELPKVDLVVVPGGFSYGDYLRCGAIAARSPIMQDIRAKALKGLKVLGVCNGFQIITEAGLLPGVLVRNKDLRFVCRQVKLKVENNQTFFTNKVARGTIVSCPVAHGEGNYICDPETLKRLEGDNRVVFRYAENTNPNGALNDIAGIMNESGTVIGMMPHPENMIEPLHGRTDCRPLFESLLAA
ncbi:phosphoribosylformylglycinamidine synthase subunit PurQ [Aestuariivirga litoralis]|uniref:Phosphoribosylformylglycinamidine synthase subunit PurQ n=1 Tax=Aestuariivirga litoralis TaxID=2650924 RepID=A0A2W2B587_9HYPH|nr:phosphoribosylformylglycinamidine synthase subunit PurQ [Aestuariivirga litoralis]PZF75474.1 phosphoribosylformylglycinamidine synthase subunit PurQ [Aestuariivirga litoralis]